MHNLINEICNSSENRDELWHQFIAANSFKNLAELGVYRGDFAQYILQNCSFIEKYIMIDPWRHLSEWNKPANEDNSEFEKYYQETLSKTDFAKNKRIVLRGKTTEVINEITDNSLDFAYIDGDHTLKGVSIDLISFWPKIKNKGFIAGDDFNPSIWQHNKNYEPTLVFPFAVYFAEAMNTTIYALPFSQFLISKECNGFKFVDFANGIYNNPSLLRQIKNKSIAAYGGSIKSKLIHAFPSAYKKYQKLFK